LTKSAITDIVGSNGIFPEFAEQSKALPYMTYKVTNHEHTHAHEGASPIAEKIIQFDCLSETYSEVISMRDALRNNLDGYQGTMTSTDVRAVIFLSESDNSNVENDAGTETIVYRKIIDYQLHVVQAVPTGV
jgi:hypothetical protein